MRSENRDTPPVFECDNRIQQQHEAEVLELISRGVPVIVNNVKMQGNYDPDYFIHKYPGEECTIHECEGGKERIGTVDAFFKTFGQQHSESDGILKLKVSPRMWSEYFMLSLV